MVGRQVCRRWREVISGAAPLWRKAANEIGLTGSIVKAYLPECGSYMELYVRALRHRKTISSCALDVVTVKELTNREASFDSVGCFKHVYVDIHEESGARIIKRVCNDRSHVIHTFDSPSGYKVKFGPFSPINNSNFVFWGEEDMGWVGLVSTDSPLCSPPSKKPGAMVDMDSKLHVWRTNELEKCAHEISVCTNCGLIVFANTVGVASVTIRKLTPGKSTVHEVRKCTLNLVESHIPYPDCDGYLYINAFFPKECIQGVCGSHYLITQPNYELSLHVVPADFTRISELPTLKLPKEIVYVQFITPSTDGSVVAFWEYSNWKYQLWEPESGRVISVVNPVEEYFDLLATGKLYSIMSDFNEFVVIETYTGKVLLKSTDKVDEAACFPPPNQTWLSTFDNQGPLPVALIDKGEFFGYAVVRRSV